MFVGHVAARTAADLVSINYHTAHLFYHKLRVLIADKLIDEDPFDGETELDDRHLSALRDTYKKSPGKPASA